MTDLVVSGPPLLDLRFGQATAERADGRVRRDFFPQIHQQEADGYLHPGVAAAAIISAAEQTVGSPDQLTSVAIQFEAPVPLGMDLAAVVASEDAGSRSVTVDLEVQERLDIQDQPLRVLAHGRLSAEDLPEILNAGAFRAAAISPVPEAEDHDLYARCFVCGQANAQGLDLRPGWQAPDTVVTAFTPTDGMTLGGRLPPSMMAALLSCPTLWACREQLDDLAAAVLTTYEVHFLEHPSAKTSLRTVGLAGEPQDQVLHGSSALIAEDGRLHAVATASWQIVGQVPSRQPGRPDPASATSPLKGGRPEDHSDPDWGRPLPGRRETAGPRSEVPRDHDGRDAMGIPVDREDPAEPRRSITDDG